MSSNNNDPYVSVVIPAYNEIESIAVLVFEIHATMNSQKYGYEIIVINDGSADGTREHLDKLAETDKQCKIIHLRRNLGQTAAMMAGID